MIDNTYKYVIKLSKNGTKLINSQILLNIFMLLYNIVKMVHK